MGYPKGSRRLGRREPLRSSRNPGRRNTDGPHDPKTWCLDVECRHPFRELEVKSHQGTGNKCLDFDCGEVSGGKPPSEAVSRSTLNDDIPSGTQCGPSTKRSHLLEREMFANAASDFVDYQERTFILDPSCGRDMNRSGMNWSALPPQNSLEIWRGRPGQNTLAPLYTV